MPETEIHFLRSFCDAVPLGVCLVDLQGKILFWNAAAETVTGYLGHEVLGRAYRGDLLVHGAGTRGNVETQSPVTQVLREGRAVEADLFLLHKLGHRVPIHVRAFALRDALGEMVGVGEILTPEQVKQEAPSWVGHTDREFELATGLSAVAETREQLQSLLRSRTAPNSGVVLIELSELDALLRHGGTAMLHQAMRVVAKTVSSLLPPRHRVGCWSEWRLLAMLPDCTREVLDETMGMLAGVGSSCAVKWWGDRVSVGIRGAGRFGDPSNNVDAFIMELEQDLKTARTGKG